jgi:CRISPR-associated protein Cas1
MRTHDNTLYVTTEKAYLAREGDALLVRVEQETRLRLPIHTIASVVCLGPVTVSPFALGLCAEHGVTVTFLTTWGRFLARVEGPVSGNVLLRRAQYQASATPAAAGDIASRIIGAKLANSRTVLLRAQRDHPIAEGAHPLAAPTANLAGILERLRSGCTLDEARGMEGDGANAYFGAFDHLITAQKESFYFRGRSRRPPMDNVNAMLSFLYTLMVHDARAACEAVGLDPQVGFLHRDRPGRPSLALDLIEDLRAFLADRLVVSLINRRQVAPKGFAASPVGGVQMDDPTRKTVITAYQKRKAEELLHPFLNEKVTVGLVPLIQARLLARHLRGDIDAYPPFFWK